MCWNSYLQSITVTLKMELLDISSKINDVLVKMDLNFAWLEKKMSHSDI